MKTLLVIVGALALVGIVYSISRDSLTTAEQPTAPEETTVPETTSGLENTNWMATMLGDQSVATLGMTAMFASGTLSGSDGCNRYNTTYTTDGSSITISPQMAGTLMACADDVMAMAQDYKETLALATMYSIENGMLMLLGSDGSVLLTFAVDAQTLSDTSWMVTGLNTGNQALVSVIIGTEITLGFGSDAMVSGNSGCNSYSGNYSVNGENLTVTDIQSTLMACADEATGTQESQYLTALQNASVFLIENNMLTIRDDAGAMQVTATRN